MSSRLRSTVSLLIALVAALGCASVPRGTAAVDAVSVQGNQAVSGSDIEEKIATTPSPKFFGLFRGVVYDYELFDRTVLQRDLERVERYYRARGYYEAHARAGRVTYKSDKHVEVVIDVEEGQPVLIRGSRIDGLGAVSPAEAAAVKRAVGRHLKDGRPFEEDPFLAAENAMKRALTARGYAWAKVDRRADVDLPGHYAYLYFTITPGPKATFGKTTIEGLGELPEDRVRRALDIAPGEPYSSETLEEAQRAILDLGTFSSVEITPVLADPPPPDAVVPLKLVVEPQKLKSAMVGGGIQIDPIRTEIHARLGWEHKNLFGGFRHFTIDFKPGLDLFPTRLPTFQAPTAVLLAERLRAELRQPGMIGARFDGVISQEVNTYPVLLTPDVDPKAPVLGYFEYKGSVGLDRTWWKLHVAPSYNFQWNDPFTYKGERDPTLTSVIVSYIDLLGQLDLRNDKLRPHKGLFLQADVQFAGLGGDARDVRLQPEVRGYIPIARKVTLAARTTVGFLMPFNYGKTQEAVGDNKSVLDSATKSRDIEITYLRGFFSGGPSSNRGYPLRAIGPHDSVPFFNPGLAAQALAQSCDPKNEHYSKERCAVPIGGLSLWEASLELRFPILGPLGGTGFCDASDVAASSFTIRLNYPHLSCGIGLRYDTPIGPVRADIGYRIPGAQMPRDANRQIEGDPGTVFGVPLAFAFGIGEAF